MRITERQLRTIVRKALLLEEDKPKERVVFDPDNVEMPMHRRVEKLTDPDMPPVKKQKFEVEVDQSGTIQQQAQALAAKALTYADMKPKDSMKLMNMSRSMLQRMIKAAGGGPGDKGAIGQGVADVISSIGGGGGEVIIDYLATTQG